MRNICFIFKASYDKANRTSIHANRGVGMEEGLRILQKIKDELDIPVTTDIHESNQANPVGQVVDMLQIPAFLCRQTDLLVAAAETGKIVNIKKAQFLSGVDMIHPVKKVLHTGNNQIILTERGNIMGYSHLVVDFRNVADMLDFGYPVVMDVTHSCQNPGSKSEVTGGSRKYADMLGRAAVAAGVNGLFYEAHPNPDKALSDASTQIPLCEIKGLISRSRILEKSKI